MKSGPSPPDVIDCLRSLPALNDLAESTLEDLSERFERRSLRSGDILFSQGESADALYIVLEGELDAVVTSPGTTELVLSTMGPGSTVGEVSFFFGGRRTATVRATTDTVLGRLSRVEVEALRVSHATILKRFLGVTREGSAAINSSISCRSCSGP